MYYIPYLDLRYLINKTLNQIIIINQNNNHWIRMSTDLWDDLCIGKADLSEQDCETLIRHGIISNSEKEYLVYQRMMKSNDDIGYNVVFNITDNCNLRCPYCFNESCSSKSSITKTAKDVISEISNLKNIKVNTITISGGEPFLFKGRDLISIIEESKKIAKRVGINTNGTIIPEEFENIIKLCDTISVSLDGNNEDTNSATRGKGNFQRTINFIERVVNLDCSEKLWLSVTASKYNYKYVPQILDVAKKYKIDMGVNFIFEIGSAVDNVVDLRIPEEAERELRKELFEYADRIEYPKYPSKFYVSEIQLAKKTCANANMLFIDDTYVYPCPGMKEEKYQLGCITELEKCLVNPIRQRLLKLNSFDQYKYDKCRRCPAKFFCGGGCYAMEMTEDRCEYYKKHLSFLLWDFDTSESLHDNMKKYGENQYDIQVL